MADLKLSAIVKSRQQDEPFYLKGKCEPNYLKGKFADQKLCELKWSQQKGNSNLNGKLQI